MVLPSRIKIGTLAVVITSLVSLTNLQSQDERPVADASLLMYSPNAHVGSGFGPDDASRPAEFLFGADTGDAGKGTVFAVMRSNLAESGALGWIVSAEVEGDIDIVDVSVRSTAAADRDIDPAGYFFHGFEYTRLIDSELPENEGRRGCYSAVVLSVVLPVSLPPKGDEMLVRMTVQKTEASAESSVGTIRWTNDLVNEIGNPLDNYVDLGGVPHDFSGLQNAEIEFRDFSQDGKGFRRCDANEDTQYDISDAVVILEGLFLGRELSTCRGFADCNADVAVDVSDAIFALDHQFGGGSAPPAPFGYCAVDENYPSCMDYLGCL